MFARELNFDIYGSTIRNTVTENVGLAVVPDIDDGTVLGEELPHRMISSYAAVPTQSCDDLVL